MKGNPMEKHKDLLQRLSGNRSRTTVIREEDHKRTLETCVDIPKEAPDFPFPVSRVGINNKTAWVRLNHGLTPFSLEILVNLPAEMKGIHMSRIEECITRLLDTEFQDIGDYSLALAGAVLACQDGSEAEVFLSGKIPLLLETSSSGKISLDNLNVSAKSSVKQRQHGLQKKTEIGAGVHHITACPCTQAYNESLFKTDSNIPMPTHSQRSLTWLQVERSGQSPGFDELLFCLDQALHLTSDLLKRPDEADIVLKAHQLPQFAEDTVRETARQAGLRFATSLPATTAITVRSESLESIHTHNVLAEIRTHLGEILAACKPEGQP